MLLAFLKGKNLFILYEEKKGKKNSVGNSMTTSCFCFGCVDSSQRGVVQQFGKFSSLATPGLNFILWPCQTISGISVKVQQLDVKTATKTKDNVTV